MKSNKPTPTVIKPPHGGNKQASFTGLDKMKPKVIPTPTTPKKGK